MTDFTTAQLSTILSALSGSARNPNTKATARKAIDRIAATLGLTGEVVLAAAPSLLDGRLDPANWCQQLTAPPEPSHEGGEQSLVRIPRPGSKQALVVDLLGREQGATLDELVAATGWLPHTTRAALTDLRRRGYSLQKVAREGRASSYSIYAGYKRVAATAVEGRVLQALRERHPELNGAEDRELIERCVDRITLGLTAIEMTLRHSDPSAGTDTITVPWSRAGIRRQREVLLPEGGTIDRRPIRAETRATLIRAIALGCPARALPV